MKLFAIIFLGIGILFALIGIGWGYVFLSNAETAGLTEEGIGPLVFTVIGLIFSAIGGGVLYYQAKQKAKRDLLLRTGRKLTAVITSVYYNNSISVNNRHPMVVECTAELSGQKQNFKSHNVWGSTQFSVGQEVAVFVDTRDHANYWVEVGD